MFSGRRVNLLNGLNVLESWGIQDLRILEVGTFDGVRACALANKWLARSSEKTATYVGFDMFEAMTKEMSQAELSKSTLPPSAQQVTEMFRTKLGITPRHSRQPKNSVRLIAGNTQVTVPEFVQAIIKGPRAELPNFIIVDGGHSLETIKSDVNALLPILRLNPNSFFILDDYYRNRDDYGCRHYLENETHGCTFNVLEPEDVVKKTGLEISMVRMFAA